MSKIILDMNTAGNAKEEVSLTVDIMDEKRQALAYNMLYHMIDNGASIMVNGKPVSAEKDQLVVRTEDAMETRYTRPHMDPEWYGANGQNFEKGAELYTTACMGNDGKLVMFAPLTCSYDKANEMNSFMLVGIDPAISISCMQDGEMKPVVANGRPIHEGLTNEHGHLRTEHTDRNWATTEAPEIQYTMAASVDAKYELVPDDIIEMMSSGYSERFESSNASGYTCPNKIAHRIRALRDFGDVKAGDLGGYIESEFNLSHTGNCWVYDQAVVVNDSVVKDDATIRDKVHLIRAAVVSGNATVTGEVSVWDNAHISEYAQVSGKWREGERPPRINGNAEISGHAKVLGDVIVGDNAKIRDNATVEGKWINKPGNWSTYISTVKNNAVIEGNAHVTNTHVENDAHIHEDAVVSGDLRRHGMTKAVNYAMVGGHAEISGHAKILNNSIVDGNAKIYGTAKIKDEVYIGYDADIKKSDDVFSLRAIGKNSSAFRNQDGSIMIFHKNTAYNGIEDFKNAMSGSLGERGRGTVRKMEEHFEAQMMQDFADALAILDKDDGQVL